MGNDSITNKNLGRRSLTVTAGVLFVISCTLAFLVTIAIFWATDLRSSTDYLNSYGYEKITYEGEEVKYGSSLYEFYYSHDPELYSYMEPEEYESYQEQYSKFKTENVFFDIEIDEKLYSDFMGKCWLIEIVSLIVAFLSAILAMTKTGQLSHDGKIKVGWFDRIFIEVDIIVAGLASLGLIVVAMLLISWLHKGEWGINLITEIFKYNPNISTIMDWADTSFFGRRFTAYLFEPRWVLLVLSLLGSLIIFTIDFIAFLSIVRRFKAYRFWRSTIIGAIIYSINDFASTSPHLKFKVLGGMIGSVVAMFMAAAIIVSLFGYNAIIPIAIGAFIMIVLILLIVPTQLQKYEMVRMGINELQKGNFTYKIPYLGKGELGRLANSVNSITEAQSMAIENELKSQRLRTDLISNVSHDIRTPLTSLVSYVDLLKKEGLSSEHAPEYVRIISDKTQRLRKLTDDLFEAAKASSGDIPVNIEKIDMSAIVEQALAELDEGLSKNEIEVIFTNHTENAHVYADGQLLWRVIENILTNVTKYALTGTRTYMDIFDRDDQIVLEVKNVSRDQLNISSNELLERFKRGDSSRNTDGSGLGLAIASDLTALMNGSFNIFIDGDLFKAEVALNKAN